MNEDTDGGPRPGQPGPAVILGHVDSKDGPGIFLDLHAVKAGAEITVDLPAQTVRGPDGKVDKFEIDPFRKHCLINGLDDIGLTMEKKASIDTYEDKLKHERAWA